ncbi:hypothetical protein Tco_0835119 [Tanacetum coccineum]
MDIPKDFQVKYVAYKLRGADNHQTGHRRQRKRPIGTWRKMKRVMFAQYVEEFTRLASRNQLSKSDAQQVVRFNNGLRYDIQAIIPLQTSWTLDEAVRMELKAYHTLRHTSSQCRVKNVNAAERGELYEESENEECFIRTEDVLDEEEDGERKAYFMLFVD